MMQRQISSWISGICRKNTPAYPIEQQMLERKKALLKNEQRRNREDY